MKAIKALALLMSVLLIVGMAVGCSNEPEPATSTPDESTAVSDVSADSDVGSLPDASGEDATTAAPDTDATTQAGGDPATTTGNAPGKTNGKTPASTTTTKKTTAQTAKLEGNLYLSGYPIVREKVTLRVMAVKGTHADYDKMRFSSVLEEKTNIKVQWMMVPEGQQVEKKELALRSGNLPHVMTLFSGIVTPSDVNRYSKEGVFLDISDKLEKYAPHAKEWIDKSPYTKTAVTMPEGQIYSLPLIRDEGPSIHYWFINKKWLDNLGLQVPKTTDELYNVMKRFKTGNPDGDNVANQVPFAMWAWHPSIFSPWGIPMTYGTSQNGIIVNKKGEVIYGYQTPNFKAAVEFWNKAYKEDLIGKKILNTDYTEYQKILAGGKVGIFIWTWPVSALGEKLAKDYVVLPMPDSKFAGDLQTGAVLHDAGVSGNTIFFTKACNSGEKGSADLAAALRWYDYFYTTEGALMKSYADPGYKYYDYKNGTYTIRDLTGMTTDQDAPSYGLPGLEVDFKSLGVKQTSNLSGEAKLVKEFEESARAAYKKQAYYGIPQLTMTADEIKQINKYQQYFGDDFSKAIGYIEGTRPMSEYDSIYLKDMSAKGVEKYLAPYKSAYERAKKTLK